MEHSPFQTPVGAVMATDRDAGVNGLIKYSLEMRDQAYFFINSSSGQIFTVSDRLDRESTHGIYQLTVYAADCAESPQPKHTATVTVAITVLDK